MNGALLSVYVENITTRKDKTVKITLGTQELDPQKAGDLFQLLNRLSVAYISPKDIDQDEIDLVDKVDAEWGGKTPSQRLRNVLYILFTENPQGFKDFDSFYRFKMESTIDELKNKIKG
jgi:hypothetical protein